jgi:hypothetical protein
MYTTYGIGPVKLIDRNELKALTLTEMLLILGCDYFS